jgi:hypothetical protein
VAGETVIQFQGTASNFIYERRFKMQKIMLILIFCISFVGCTPIVVPVTELVNFPIVLRTEAIKGETKNNNRAAGFVFVRVYSDNKENTKFSVLISDLAPKSIHSGQIRVGECNDKSDKFFAQLNSIQADEFGDGQNETLLPTKKFDANKAKQQNLFIVYYQRSEGDPKGTGDPIVCGDLKYRK